MTNEAVVAFHPHYMRLFNDAVIALVCSQLHYWYTPTKGGACRLKIAKSGYWWLAKPYKDWYAECGLTPKQARRAIDVLCDVGVLVRVNYRFNNLHTAHLRLAHFTGRQTLKAGTYITDGVWPTGVPARSPEVPYRAVRDAPQGSSLTETTTETTTEINYAGVPAKHSEKTAHDLFEEAIMKARTTNSDAILQKLHEQKKLGVSAPKNTPSGLYSLWCQATPLYNENVKFVRPFTRVEMAQLKRLITLWGDLASSVLLTILKRWVGYTKYVEKMAGVFNTPLAPNPGFVVKYAEQAMNYHLECVESDESSDPAAMVGLASPAPVLTLKKNSAANCTTSTAKPAVPLQKEPSDAGDHVTTLADILEYKQVKAHAGSKGKKAPD